MGMIKKIGKFLLCATMILALAACGDNGAKGGEEGTEASQGTESSVESSTSEGSATESSQAGNGDDQWQQYSPMELYEKFLADEVKVKKGSNELNVESYYGKTQPFYVPFVDDEGYTLKELVRRAQEFDNENDPAVFTSSVEYSYLDLGNDNVPELLLQVYHNGGAWNEARDYRFVIAKGDSGLELIFMSVSDYNSSAYFLNQYGFMISYAYDSDNNVNDYGFVDAKGVYHHLYSTDTYYGMGAFYGLEEGVPAAAAKYLQESGDEYFFDGLDFVVVRIGEDPEKADPIYSYIAYQSYEDYDQYTLELAKEKAEQAFVDAGVKYQPYEEVKKQISAYAKQQNATDLILEEQTEGGDYLELSRDEFWPGTVVTVNNVNDMMAAVKDNTMILLEPGTYDVTKWVADNISKIPGYYYDESYNGNRNAGVVYMGSDEEEYEVVFARLHNLIIGSADPKNPAHIVSHAIYARVMYFENCSNISLENVVMGHDITVGECAGDVLGFDYTDYPSLTGCDLYGCGVFGVGMYWSNYSQIKDCTIHDCTYGCIYATECGWVDVRNSVFRDCNGGSMFAGSASYYDFNECTFKNLYGDIIDFYNDEGYAYFYDCQFDAYTLNSIQNSKYYGDHVTVY